MGSTPSNQRQEEGADGLERANNDPSTMVLPSSSQQREDIGGATWHPSSGGDRSEKVRRRKPPSLSSLKKKIVNKRKNSGKIPDSSKSMKEMLATWNPLDIHSLVEEYDALAAIKQLTIFADLARPSAPTLKQDLLNLCNNKHCCDVNLKFRGTIFPVHRAILTARCSYFRSLLRKFPSFQAEVRVDLGIPGVTVEMFSALLRYLYTGDFFNTRESCMGNFDTFITLGEKFGTPNPLEHDFVHMLENKRCSDAVLIFSSEEEPVQQSFSGSLRARPHSLRCHRAILAARSPFFRNLLQRREHRTKEGATSAHSTLTQIVLDESVIPKKYALVLLHALYRDVVDLGLVIPSSPSIGSLGEVQELVAGKTPLSRLDQAMELYQIAQFLELSSMVQGCEDYIASNITVENLISILNWSSQPHGSSWVWRQAVHFLREEFTTIASKSVLFELKESLMIEILRSDFVQASEADILKTIVKWGEYQLIRRMEEREPNLLSHTQHSVTRKGIKRRDLDTTELREIISNLIPLVRFEHILPQCHESLASAVKRGLVCQPPSYMFAGSDDLSPRYNHWVAGSGQRLRKRPRLYTPFVEEAKACLEEQTISDIEAVKLRRIRMSCVPDALYMVGHQDSTVDGWLITRSRSCPHPVIAGSFPAPDDLTMKAMLSREKELKRTDAVKRAYTYRCTDSAAVSREIQVRVVREFGLPDEAVEVFDSSPIKGTFSEFEDLDIEDEVFRPRWNEPPDLQLQHEPPRSPEISATAEVAPMLSEIMPDIAIPSGPDLTIATAPPVNQMLLREPQLGDDSSQNQRRYNRNQGNSREKKNTKLSHQVFTV